MDWRNIFVNLEITEYLEVLCAHDTIIVWKIRLKVAGHAYPSLFQNRYIQKKIKVTNEKFVHVEDSSISEILIRDRFREVTVTVLK